MRDYIIATIILVIAVGLWITLCHFLPLGKSVFIVEPVGGIVIGFIVAMVCPIT
jgi:membrane associated rhomboid family serine protease